MTLPVYYLIVLFATFGSKNTTTVSCDNAKVQIQVWDDDIIRVWLSEDGKFDHYNSYNQYMIQPGLDNLSGPESLSVTDVGYIKIQTSKVTVRINKAPFRLSFYKRDNKTLVTQNPEDNGYVDPMWLAADNDHTYETTADGRHYADYQERYAIERDMLSKSATAGSLGLSTTALSMTQRFAVSS